MMQHILKPIFFIGVPRSGTTITFEVFSAHEELAWFSNNLETLPKLPFVSFMARITRFNGLRGAKKQINKQSWIKNILPYPAESYAVWKSCCGRKFLYDYLVGQIATDLERFKTRRMISKVLSYQGKKRYAAKLTGPSRIEYLNSIFPDAIFIHIVRDGRAVVNSLINAGFWKQRGGYDRPWWQNGLTKKDFNIYNRYSKSPLALAAIQWDRIITIARREAANISTDRYHEIKYENFISETRDQINKLFELTKLKKSNKVYTYLEKHVKLSNQNFKYLKIYNKTDLKMLNDIMGDTLTSLNYDI